MGHPECAQGRCFGGCQATQHTKQFTTATGTARKSCGILVYLTDFGAMMLADGIENMFGNLALSVGEILHDAGERLLIWGARSAGHLTERSVPVSTLLSTRTPNSFFGSFPRLSREQAAFMSSLLFALTVPVFAGLLIDLLRDGSSISNNLLSSKTAKVMSARGVPVELTPLETEVAKAGLLDPEDAGASEDFGDVGGLDAQVAILREQIILPLARPSLTSHSKILGAPTGLLLYGPPGSGKTLLARGLARAAKARFLALSPASLQSKWVGDTVRLVAAAFSLARKIAPCIVFVDEIDGLLPSREKASINFHTVELTTTFLREWEGIQAGEGARAASSAWVLVVGATNRPYDLDKAVLRRLPRQVEVPLPDAEGRCDIITKLLIGERAASKPTCDPSIIADLTPGYSGSDLRELVRQAAWIPVREAVNAGEDHDALPRLIITEDLVAALEAAPKTGERAEEFRERENGGRPQRNHSGPSVQCPQQ